MSDTMKNALVIRAAVVKSIRYGLDQLATGDRVGYDSPAYLNALRRSASSRHQAFQLIDPHYNILTADTTRPTEVARLNNWISDLIHEEYWHNPR